MLRHEAFGGDSYARRAGDQGIPQSAWDEVERRSRRDRRVRGVVLPILAVVGVGVLFGYGSLVAGQVSRYRLDHHGVLARATVIRVRTVTESGEDGNSYQYYVDVEIPGTNVVVELGVSQPTFPVGTTILIRYDPKDPSHAIAAEDAPFPLLLVCLTIILVATPFVVWGVYVDARHKREAWQRRTSLGWAYEEKAPPLDVALASFGTGSRPDRKDLVRGTREGATFSAFACTVGGGESSTTYRVVAVETPTRFPHLWVHRRRRLRVIMTGPGRQLPVLAIGSPEFTKVFEVR